MIALLRGLSHAVKATMGTNDSTCVDADFVAHDGLKFWGLFDPAAPSTRVFAQGPTTLNVASLQLLATSTVFKRVPAIKMTHEIVMHSFVSHICGDRAFRL